VKIRCCYPNHTTGLQYSIALGQKGDSPFCVDMLNDFFREDFIERFVR
jgi:hypothetical protein